MTDKINHNALNQVPPPLPSNFRRGSQGQQTSQGQADRTPMGRQPYEFDSCISTEEAFFGQIGEEIKNCYRLNTGDGSNPQEDNTPKAHPATGFHRRTVESINRGIDGNHQQQAVGSMVKTMGFTAANRQRTQRLSPKGRSMGREMHMAHGETQLISSPKHEGRARNQSVKLLHLDESQGSSGNQKIKSDVASPKLHHKQQSRPRVNKNKISSLNSQGNQEVTPLMKQRSSNESGFLSQNLSDDLGGGKSTPVRRSVSRQSVRSPSEDKKRIKLLGSSFKGLNNGLNSRQRGPVNNGKEIQERPGNSESQRVIQPVVHTGQQSMKMDMKFGWRPEFNDKDRLHRKEAIAIKLTYPSNVGIMKTSVRQCNLFVELYRQNKNHRALKAQVKKTFVPDYPSKLIYQGYRPSVSIELHLRYGQKAGFNEDSQFYDVLIPKNIKAKAIESGFHKHTPRSPVDDSTLKNYDSGLNQDTLPCDLTFDSMFESGNLDLAIQVQPREFNLYLKPDTNTKGYCSWFYFKVMRKPDSKGKFPRRTYQFNIMNMYKKKILYQQEAKPLACTQEILYKGFIMQELENVQWKASQFSNIGYGLVSAQTVAAPATAVSGNNHHDSQIEAIKEQTLIANDAFTGQNRKQKFFCLAFDFEFLSGQEFAYIASSIPYPYTFLQKTIKTCARLDQSMSTLTRSLGGLQIPMLTITNEIVDISKKRIVIICGRIHPGETNSSWVLHGMIDYLISKDASHLRDSLVFKIVPMINPDGVVAGNYRTSFIGKDLNRLYLNSDEANNNMEDVLKPEITAMKQLIKGCKQEDSKGILAFIDVHHHSQKRGAFMFGPSYQMQNSKYQEVRVLPKLISMMLPEMFRFQSCRFKNQSYKENCARLYCDKEQGITYSFCLECSQQGYFTQSPAGVKGRHVKYFDQNSLMCLGRKICEASFMLNEMSDVQDLKRDAIQRRRKLRLGKKGKKGVGGGGGTTGKSGAGPNSQSYVGGRTGGQSGAFRKESKGVATEASSMGATDFDLESDDRGDSSNKSITSQDFLQSGFNPKIGIKGFIAQMMNKPPKTGKDAKLQSDSSRGALRAKNTRPLTHFGSEDAVSEKSEKDEESLSEDGSDCNSSAQDLSEDDHNQVLDQVLDQLMPNRVKKIDPVSAHITIKKQPQIEQMKVAYRKKSANRVIVVDKRLIQKEQLLIPTAAPDLNINNGTINFQVSSNKQNFELTKGPTPNFDDLNTFQITTSAPLNSQKIKEDLKKVAIEKGNDSYSKNSYKNKPQQLIMQKIVQGCYLPNTNQGYISQRQMQNKQRVFSGKHKKQASKDMFANTGYMPPSAQRQTFAQTNLKVHYNNIYSMVQSSAAQSAYYAQNQALNNGTAPTSGIASPDIVQDDFSNQQVLNRQSLRTAGNLQHSYSHHDKGEATELGWATFNEQGSGLNNAQNANNIASPTPLIRQSFTRTRPRASPQDFTSSQQLNMMSGTGTGSRNETQARVLLPSTLNNKELHQSLDQPQQIIQPTTGTGFYQPGLPLESQWMLAQQQLQHINHQDQQQHIENNNNSQILKTPGKPPRSSIGAGSGPSVSKHSTALFSKSTKQKSNPGGILSSKDIMLNTTGFSGLNEQHMVQVVDANHMFASPGKPSNVPLSQGGFFHRNQVVGYTDAGLEDHILNLKGQHHSAKQANPDVIIRTKPHGGVMSQKRKSAIATLKILQSQAGPVNRISHKRQSQQLLDANLGDTQQSSGRGILNNANPRTSAASHRKGGFVMNEDLHERVMHGQLPINSQLLYSSPQKQSTHIRMHSGHPKYAKTVAKKTDALMVPTASSANVMSQNELLDLKKQAPKQRIAPQTSHGARKLIMSQMQRNGPAMGSDRSQQQQRVLTGLSGAAAFLQRSQNNNSNDNNQFIRIGHERSQTGGNKQFYNEAGARF